MKLTFLGATGTVTGSKYLLEHNNKKILIDCGLFQGLKELRLRNWRELPINPASIDSVILTHAHIDHSGYIPLLVKNGFKGRIYCSPATYDLCSILLPDSGYLQEVGAERANRYGYTKHNPAKALYTQRDADKSLEFFSTVPFSKPKNLIDGLSFSLHHAGHILGSSFIKISDGDKSILFSGDIGRMNDDVMLEPAKIQNADYIVVESTYGDRKHGESDPLKKIGKIVRSTAARGGSIVIPAFAVGRAQSMLYYIYMLKQMGKIPDMPVFLDSPMAINATDLMCKYKNEHKLPSDLCRDVCNIATHTRTAEESKAILTSHVPSIIISASGMATGGRILHHFKHFIVEDKNTILFSGYQAAGTRGARIINGEKEIKIHGSMYKVNAQIELLHSTSAHADYEEILTWLGNFQNTPRKVFVTHGEPKAALSMKNKIEDKFGWQAEVPEYLQEEDL